MADELRIDDLARAAGVATTTVRLYQARRLLPPPRLEGRTGWYDDTHLARLRLIARLQEEGHSLAGIGDLLAQWEQGRSLDAVVGVEAGLDALLSDAHAVVLDATDVLDHFPAGSMTPELMQRAATLGLISLTEAGQVRVTDRRFLDTGSALANLGLPLDVVLDEWETLVGHTDAIAESFLAVFERDLLPADWQTDLGATEAHALATTLARLQAAARQILVAALDASIARVGRDRLGHLIQQL